MITDIEAWLGLCKEQDDCLHITNGYGHGLGDGWGNVGPAYHWGHGDIMCYGIGQATGCGYPGDGHGQGGGACIGAIGNLK